MIRIDDNEWSLEVSKGRHHWPLPVKVVFAWLLCLLILLATIALYFPWWTSGADGEVLLAPTITSVALSGSLPSTGGAVILTAHLKGAHSCQVKVLSSQGLKVTVGKPFPCVSVYKTLVTVKGKGTKNTVTLDFVATAPDPEKSSRLLYLHLAAPKAPPPSSSTTTTTTPPAAGGGGGGGLGGTTSTGVALDPVCTADVSVAYEQHCLFSLATPGINGGTLAFETTLVPNNPNAPLNVLATPGCTLSVSTTSSSSTCVIQYPGAGTYEVQTLYSGGPGAYSASQEEAITVPAPVVSQGPVPSATVLTANASTLGLSVTDLNGPVATPAGSVQVQLEVFNASNGGLQATWFLTTTSVGQTSCDYGWTQLHGVWTPQSQACTVSGGSGPGAENGSDNFTAQALFAGDSSDLPSVSTQIVLPAP